ncbi:MAG: hypothetical protein PUC65_16555 [Clostridiales bacterium]|nr:hypothetical protein [Clostridiales bacterium]
MNIYDFMEGYDRSFDEDEFDARVWSFMQEEDFEFSEDFEHFLRGYGFDDLHQFLKVIREKRDSKII